jgi:DNA mismatch endonuclease Vsr
MTVKSPTPAEGGGARDVSGGSAGRTVNLGGGLIVPYPEPTSPAATKIGKANLRTGTKPEVELRSALHRAGLRFRKDLLIQVAGIRVRPDVVFTRRKVAVFVDGCFWHGCPDHQHLPKSNQDYWIPKLRANSSETGEWMPLCGQRVGSSCGRGSTSP